MATTKASASSKSPRALSSASARKAQGSGRKSAAGTRTKSDPQWEAANSSPTPSGSKAATRSQRKRSAAVGSRRRVTTVPQRPRSIGAPESYGEVSVYFRTVSDRARALGVQRNTVRKWDEGAAARLRTESHDRVQLLLSAARDVRDLMGDPFAVGRWLLTQQPGLRGVAPAELLLQFGGRAQEVVRQLAMGVSPVRDKDVPGTETFWRALESKLDATDLVELRDSVERARGGGVSGALSL